MNKIKFFLSLLFAVLNVSLGAVAPQNHQKFHMGVRSLELNLKRATFICFCSQCTEKIKSFKRDGKFFESRDKSNVPSTTKKIASFSVERTELTPIKESK